MATWLQVLLRLSQNKNGIIVLVFFLYSPYAGRDAAKYFSSLTIVLAVSSARYRNITTNQSDPLRTKFPTATNNFARYMGWRVKRYGPLEIISSGTCESKHGE